VQPGAALFVSDLHLSPDAPATVARFLTFLAGTARTAGSLTILGDLFDYWAGDDDLEDAFNACVVGALREVAAVGVTISFMTGNRDLLISDGFAAAAGLTLLPDPCVRDVAGIKTLLTHGDALCTDDVDYQRFRSMVHDPGWQTAFLARPLAERKAEIVALRQRSEGEKKIKPLAVMDVNADSVCATLRQYGAQALIHGHTHRQGIHTHHVDGQSCQRWVLSDWHADQGGALACTADGWKFMN
jgi:UDP-2,3-diacylglucosamine hydrolase